MEVEGTFRLQKDGTIFDLVTTVAGTGNGGVLFRRISPCSPSLSFGCIFFVLPIVSSCRRCLSAAYLVCILQGVWSRASGTQAQAVLCSTRSTTGVVAIFH